MLFQIDPRTFQAQYNQALAQLARDKAQLENARAQQERLQPLLKREFITRQEYDVAVTSAEIARSDGAADRGGSRAGAHPVELRAHHSADLRAHRHALGQSRATSCRRHRRARRS